MDENTMNLGGLAGNTFSSGIPDVASQAPVYESPKSAFDAQPVTSVIPEVKAEETTTTVNTLNITGNGLVATDSNLSASTTIANEEVKEEVKPEIQGKPIVVEPKDRNDCSIPVQNLQDLLNYVTKVAIGDNRNNITTIIQLKFAHDGLYISGTNKRNTIVAKDTTNHYSDEKSICVEASKFADLVSKLDDGDVTLELNAEKHWVTVKSGQGEWILQEKYDISSGEAINIDIPSEYNQAEILPEVDMDGLKTKINKVTAFEHESTESYLSSYLIIDNILFITDKNNMATQHISKGLENVTMLIPITYTKLLMDLNLNPIVKFGIIKDETGRVSKLAVYNEGVDYTITITGDLRSAEDQASFFERAWPTYNSLATVEYSCDMVVNKDQLSKVLDRACIFISDDDKNVCDYKCEGSYLEVRSRRKNSVEKIAVKPSNTQVQSTLDMEEFNFNLNTVQYNKALKNYTSDRIRFFVDKNKPQCVKTVSGIVRVTTDETNKEVITCDNDSADILTVITATVAIV